MKQTHTTEPDELKSWLFPFTHKTNLEEFVKAFTPYLRPRLEQFHRLSDTNKDAVMQELLSAIWLYAEELRKVGPQSLSPTEAIYGFVAFLTTRDAAITFGSRVPPCGAIPLIDRFAKAQGWSIKCRDNWTDYLHPVPPTIADVSKQ